MSVTTNRTANEIIEQAFKIIGVFSEDSNLSGKRLKEGFDNLNNILSSYRSESQMIAYDSTITFNLVIGQRQYEISNEVTADVTSNLLSRITFVTLTDGDLQYSIGVVPDNMFYARDIVLNESRMPTQVFLQQANDKSFLNFIVLPDNTYSCTVKGKFVLSDLVLNTDISTIPLYYTLHLELALARVLYSLYPGSKWSEMDERRYQETKEDLMSVADIDMITTTSNVLNGNYGGNTFNFNSGW